MKVSGEPHFVFCTNIDTLVPDCGIKTYVGVLTSTLYAG